MARRLNTLGQTGPFDAVVSLATLHHFTSRGLAAIYADLARLIQPGGLLLNAEGLAAGPPSRTWPGMFDEARGAARRRPMVVGGDRGRSRLRRGSSRAGAPP